MTTTQVDEIVTARPGLEQVESRTANPVKWWAFVGIVSLTLIVYMWGRWLIEGQYGRIPAGDSIQPTWLKVSVWAQQIGYPLLTIIFAYIFLIRPWRREGRITLDGMMFIVWGVMWAMADPWLNYSRPQLTYNSMLWNFGCPQCNAPGWMAPNGGHIAENIVAPGLYFTGMFIGVVWANWAMRKAKQRWPRIGTFGLIAVCYAFLGILDFAMEIPWNRLGIYTYPGGIGGVTMFHGHYYQFPIYEVIFWTACWTSVAALRYFTDDKGQTIVERGVDRIHATPRQKTALRFLAILGFCQAMFLVYCVGMNFFGIRADNFPDDVLQRSYFTTGICGAGTQQACPGPQVPLPVGPGSVHLTPGGGIVAPRGVPNQNIPLDRDGPLKPW